MTGEIDMKYCIGMTLYYVDCDKIKSTKIDSFKIIYTEVSYYGNRLEITYHLDIGDYVMEQNIDKGYYLDKKEIIQNFVSQL